MTIQVDPQTPVKMMNGMMIDASIRVASWRRRGSQGADRRGELADRVHVLVPAGHEPHFVRPQS